jgi:hypothetical protein
LLEAVTLRTAQAASSRIAATTALTSSNSALKISSAPSASRIQTISRITTKNVVSESNIRRYLSPGGLVAAPPGEVQACRCLQICLQDPEVPQWARSRREPTHEIHPADGFRGPDFFSRCRRSKMSRSATSRPIRPVAPVQA